MLTANSFSTNIWVRTPHPARHCGKWDRLIQLTCPKVYHNKAATFGLEKSREVFLGADMADRHGWAGVAVLSSQEDLDQTEMITHESR